MKLYGAASRLACHEKRTAAKEEQALGSGTNKRAIRDTYSQDNTSKSRFKSGPMLPVGSDGSWSAGLVSAAEAEALSPTEARHG